MALRSAEAIYQELLQNPADVVITPEEAGEIWQIFRGYPIDPGRLGSLKFRAFLQAALMSAQDGSEAMSWIEALFRSAYKPNASVKSIIKKMATHALKQYYRKATGGEQKLYKSVINAIAYGHKFYFDAINQGLEELM